MIKLKKSTELKMLFVSSDNLKPGMVLAMDITIYNKYNFKTLLLSKGQPPLV